MALWTTYYTGSGIDLNHIPCGLICGTFCVFKALCLSFFINISSAPFNQGYDSLFEKYSRSNNYQKTYKMISEQPPSKWISTPIKYWYRNQNWMFTTTLYYKIHIINIVITLCIRSKYILLMELSLKWQSKHEMIAENKEWFVDQCQSRGYNEIVPTKSRVYFLSMLIYHKCMYVVTIFIMFT